MSNTAYKGLAVTAVNAAYSMHVIFVQQSFVIFVFSREILLQNIQLLVLAVLIGGIVGIVGIVEIVETVM